MHYFIASNTRLIVSAQLLLERSSERSRFEDTHPSNGLALQTLTVAGDSQHANSTDSALLCSAKSDAGATCAESRERSAFASAHQSTGLCALALAACLVPDALDDAGSATTCVSAPHSEPESLQNHVSDKRALDGHSPPPAQSKSAADGDASPIAIADTAHCDTKRQQRRRRLAKAKSKSSLSVASVAYLLLAANSLHTFVCYRMVCV